MIDKVSHPTCTRGRVPLRLLATAAFALSALAARADDDFTRPMSASGGLFGAPTTMTDFWEPDIGYDRPVVTDERSCVDCSSEMWVPQLLPGGLIYRSYLAGAKEPRLGSFWAYEKDEGWIWDIALGGRVGLFRYGTTDGARPDGWQLDVEGAAFPRLDPEEERDLVSADFRAGVPLTYGDGAYQVKFAYYHLSSHLGDEFMLKNPTIDRVNYSRDELVWGHSYYVTDDLRLYVEVGWAFVSDVAEPWEYQFGVDYSPVGDYGFGGSPFAAFNGHLREEVDFGGNFVVQTGWQWRQAANGHLFRAGVEYFNGKDDQFEFYTRSQEKVGFGIWYDY